MSWCVSRTDCEHFYLTPWERGVGQISALLGDPNSSERWKWSHLKQHQWPVPAGERQQWWSNPAASVNKAGRSKWVLSTLQLQCEFFKLSLGENNALWEVKLTWQPWSLPLVGQRYLPQSHHNGNPSHQKHHPVQDLCQLWKKEREREIIWNIASKNIFAADPQKGWKLN